MTNFSTGGAAWISTRFYRSFYISKKLRSLIVLPLRQVSTVYFILLNVCGSRETEKLTLLRSTSAKEKKQFAGYLIFHNSGIIFLSPFP